MSFNLSKSLNCSYLASSLDLSSIEIPGPLSPDHRPFYPYFPSSSQIQLINQVIEAFLSYFSFSTENQQDRDFSELVYRMPNDRAVVRTYRVYTLFSAQEQTGTEALSFEQEFAENLREQGRINQRDPRNGWTFLMIECAKAEPNLELVRQLLIHGADPNIGFFMGETVLINAIRRGRSDLVSLLIEHGANPALCDSVGWSPLKFALVRAEGQRSEHALRGIELVLEALASQKNLTAEYLFKHLMIAIEQGWAEAAKLILAFGAPLHLGAASEQPAFHLVLNHSLDVLQVLLEYCSLDDLEALDLNGDNILLNYISNQKWELLRFIIERIEAHLIRFNQYALRRNSKISIGMAPNHEMAQMRAVLDLIKKIISIAHSTQVNEIRFLELMTGRGAPKELINRFSNLLDRFPPFA